MPHPAINIKNHWVTRAVRESPINEKYYKTVERSSSKVYNFCKPISSNHPHHAAVHNITHQCLAEIMDKDGKPYKPRRTCYRFFYIKKTSTGRFCTSQLTTHMNLEHRDIWAKSQKQKESDDAVAGATIEPGPLVRQFQKMASSAKVLSPRRRIQMLYKQALADIYSRGKLSLRTTEHPIWRAMVVELVGPCEGKPSLDLGFGHINIAIIIHNT